MKKGIVNFNGNELILTVVLCGYIMYQKRYAINYSDETVDACLIIQDGKIVFLNRIKFLQSIIDSFSAKDIKNRFICELDESSQSIPLNGIYKLKETG